MKDNFLNDKESEIFEWIREKYNGLSIPLYNSFDLRISYNKICPVDANFFPAAFNRLPREFEEESINYFQEYLKQIKSDKILLIPENYFNNLHYFSSINRLKRALEQTNKEVVIGTINQAPDGKVKAKDAENNEFELFSLRIRDNILKTSNGFCPDLILMNNDMRKVPVLIEKARQTVIPNLQIGWWKRDKITFFQIYNQLIEELCKTFNLNKFSFSIETEMHIFDNNFSSKVKNLLNKLRELYKLSNVKEDPYIIVKPSKGTYGKSIISISSEGDIEKSLICYNNIINDKNIENRKLIIQEGIRTVLSYNEAAAEPVIYTIGDKILSGFYRYNKTVDEMGNLNRKSTEFSENLILNTDIKLISQLTNLAASIEYTKIKE